MSNLMSNPKGRSQQNCPRTLGTSKVCITPEHPVRLCGFGFRKTSYEAVRKDIYVRIYDLCEGPCRVVLIYGDLLWWNTDFVKRMKRKIHEELGIEPEQLLFTASHNHSGPGTGNTFIPLLETGDDEYLEYLSQKILSALKMARESREEVVMTRTEGSCRLNVYRRRMTAEGIQMMPNYQVEPDTTLTVFDFRRRDGSLKGRMVHYPCHANLSKDNELHPDYPGYVLEELDRDAPGSVSIFLQGCTADLRPNCVLGEQFRDGSGADVEAFAAYLCEAVHGVAEGGVGAAVTVGAAAAEIIGPGMSLKHERRNLPLIQDFTEMEVDSRLSHCQEEVRQWAAKVKEKGLRDFEELELSLLTLGGQRFYFFNAEVSMHYARLARKHFPGAVCSGYTNGMIGYLTTAEQIARGGYEPRDSAIYFAVAGTYGEMIQDMMEQLILTM